MTLRDLLKPGQPVKYCQERTNLFNIPDGIFTGACEWTGKELIPCDGDIYSLDDPVFDYRWEEDGTLTYWIESTWLHEKPAGYN